LTILRALPGLRAHGFPLLLGASRKRVVSLQGSLAVEQREETTLATTVAGVASGVDLFRVHDVRGNARAAALADMIYRSGEAADG